MLAFLSANSYVSFRRAQVLSGPAQGQHALLAEKQYCGYVPSGDCPFVPNTSHSRADLHTRLALFLLRIRKETPTWESLILCPFSFFPTNAIQDMDFA